MCDSQGGHNPGFLIRVPHLSPVPPPCPKKMPLRIIKYGRNRGMEENGEGHPKFVYEIPSSPSSGTHVGRQDRL